MHFGNKYTFTLLSFAVASLVTSAPAHAGLGEWCQKLLSKVTGQQIMTAEQRKHFRPSYAPLLAGKVDRSRVPVSRVDSQTSSPNLLTDFGYWWFPGNIWHSLMMPHYQDLGTRIQNEFPNVTSLTRDELTQNQVQFREDAGTVEPILTNPPSPYVAPYIAPTPEPTPDRADHSPSPSYEPSPSYDSGSSSYDSGSSSYDSGSSSSSSFD